MSLLKYTFTPYAGQININFSYEPRESLIKDLKEIIGVTHVRFLDRYTIHIKKGELFNWITIQKSIEILLTS